MANEKKKTSRMSVAYCQNSKCPPLARTLSIIALSTALVLKAVPKCPTVPQRRELVTGTRAAGQGNK